MIRHADIHCHYLAPSVVRLINGTTHLHGVSFVDLKDRHGVQIDRNGQTRFIAVDRRMTDLSERLRYMDAVGIDLQIACAPMYDFLFDVDRATDGELLRRQNDGVAAMVASSGRFRGLAALPLYDVDKALAELDRALNLGLTGAVAQANIEGLDFDDARFGPFLAEAERRRFVIFVHPSAIHPPSSRLDEFNLSVVVGFTIDTAIAISRVIFGGVLERFPSLNLVFAHAGGMLPYQAGRLDRGFRTYPQARTKITNLPTDYLRRLHFDTLTHSRLALRYLVDMVGSDRVLLGTDYPFFSGMMDEEPMTTLASLELSQEEYELVSAGNALRLTDASGIRTD